MASTSYTRSLIAKQNKTRNDLINTKKYSMLYPLNKLDQTDTQFFIFQVSADQNDRVCIVLKGRSNIIPYTINSPILNDV